MAFLTRAKRTQDKETAVKHAGLRREIAANTAAAKKATSPLEIAKQTILGIPKAGVDVAKDVAKGAVEFAVSAGEAPVRLASPKASTAVLPKTKIPGLPFLGEVESFQNRAARAVRDEGASVPEAIAKGTLDVALNEPLGLAVKPLAVGGGILLRQAAKGGARLDLGLISRIVNGGKKAATEAAPVADEFAGMTLPERLAATGERKLPVYGDTTPRRIPVDGQSRTQPVPFANDYRMGPDIPVGPKPRSTVPVAATSPEKRGSLPSGFRYAPVETPRAPSASVPVETGPAPRIAPKTAPAPVSEAVAPPVSRETTTIPAQNGSEIVVPDTAPAPRVAPDPTGEMKQSGLARGVETQAVEKKLTDGFEGLSEYETINIKDQAERAADIITRDVDKAKRIAMGLEDAPEGTKAFAVYTALEQKAIKDGDVATLRDLATRSRLNRESSESAQTLRLLAERDPDSPVAAIADIAKTRAAVAERRGTKVAAAVKSETTKAKAAIAKAPKEDWNSFVDSITC